MSASRASARSAGRSGGSWARRRRSTARGPSRSGRPTASSPAGRDRAVSEERGAPRRGSVAAMFSAISHTFINVLDQDEALDFYVGKLGFEVKTDADLGHMRWLTLALPSDPAHELVLMAPGDPMHDEATAAQVRELVTKGALSGFILTTDDCRKTYEELRAKGVEFTQEPEERFYGIDCGLRDPFGTPIRITQPAPGPIQVPEPATSAG